MPNGGKHALAGWQAGEAGQVLSAGVAGGSACGDWWGVYRRYASSKPIVTYIRFGEGEWGLGVKGERRKGPHSILQALSACPCVRERQREKRLRQMERARTENPA